MSRYLISVDGGGSKTEICVFDKNDSSTAIFECGATNYKTKGIEHVEKVFTSIFGEIREALNLTNDEILGTVMGLSGCDTQADKAILKEIIAKTGLDMQKVFLCNDCEFMMYSAADLPGICIVSGTGSIGFGFDSATDTVRAGGYGYKLSDLGSGYWIGMQILREYLKYVDDLVPYIAVFDEIEEHYEKSTKDLVDLLVTADPTTIASCAKVVLNAANDQDPLCQSIAKAAAFSLANICSSIYKKLETSSADKIDVVLAGSVFKNEFLKSNFKEQCIEQTTYKNFNFVEIETSAAETGIEFAKKIFLR